MTLYLYRLSGKLSPVVIENVAEYTASHVLCSDGVVYEPLSDDCELSSLPDCSETLRADWRAANPSTQSRIDDLEALVAELLFGGEAV